MRGIRAARQPRAVLQPLKLSAALRGHRRFVHALPDHFFPAQFLTEFRSPRLHQFRQLDRRLFRGCLGLFNLRLQFGHGRAMLVGFHIHQRLGVAALAGQASGLRHVVKKGKELIKLAL